MIKSYQSLDDLLNDCTVRVKTKGGHGTGFFVASGLILTCAHVIEDALKPITPISAYCNYNQETIPVGQIGGDDVFSGIYPDLALLRVDVHDHPCVLLGTEFRAFTDFYSYGYTKDHPDGESTTVECEGTLEYGGTLIKLKDGQVKPGASGSPLLNKKTGLVCGMITNTRDRNSDLGGAGAPMEIIFAKFPDLLQQNLAFHHSNARWSSLLEKEQNEITLSSIVAFSYNEPGKIARPKYFVGREQIVHQVASLLDRSCQVLLTGMAGIGKTALAQVLVDEQLKKGRGEVIWVEVKYEKVESIIEALADCLGDDQISKLKHVEEKIPILKTLLEKSKAGLLVLENVHNVEAADKLLSVVPKNMAVLITSRQRFVVEEIIEVDMLSSADALKMLEQTSGFKDLSNNPDAVFLCKQLGYHPYALELAGSMMRELNRTPKELRRRLAGAPLDLSSSTRGRLRALLDDSVANLDGNTRDVLFAFGVFPTNGATSTLLATYLDKSIEEISNSLDELIKRNLIKRRPETEFYFMHDLTFYYVSSQAKPENEEDEQNLVDSILRYLAIHRYDYDLVGLDLSNLLAIARSSKGLDLVKMICFLTIGNYPLQDGRSYADQRGYSIGLIEQLDRAIEAAKNIGDELKHTTHYLLGKRGNAAFDKGDYPLAVEKYREELELSPNEERQVKIGSILARTLVFCGRQEESRTCFDVASRLANKLNNNELRGFVLEQESHAAGYLKDYITALNISEKQLSLAEGLFEETSSQEYEPLALALLNFGSAKLDLARQSHSEVSGILDTHTRARILAEKHEDDRLRAHAHRSLGEYYHYVKDKTLAQWNFSQALEIWHALGMIREERDLITLMHELDYSVLTSKEKNDEHEK